MTATTATVELLIADHGAFGAFAKPRSREEHEEGRSVLLFFANFAPSRLRAERPSARATGQRLSLNEALPCA
jgi:hypothetical protein